MPASRSLQLGKYPQLRVLGLPCNQFMNQEPGDNGEILATLQYVRPGGGYKPAFPLTQKTSVNGGLIHPLYTLIKAACNGPTDDISDITPSWTPVNARDVQWNFEPVLFGKNGLPYRRYATGAGGGPMAMEADIQYLLSQ